MTIDLINKLAEKYLESPTVSLEMESHFEIARELLARTHPSPEDVANLEIAIERIRSRRRILDFQPKLTEQLAEQERSNAYRYPGYSAQWNVPDEWGAEVEIFREEEMADYLRLLDEAKSSPVSDPICEEVD